MMAASDVHIAHLVDLAEPEQHRPGLEAIFFAASATQSFASEAVRQVFLERWFGRFLEHYADGTFVALDASSRGVLGYVIGSLMDPASDPRFADIGYFAKLAHLTPAYPAHLHVNLAADARNLGIGSRLITRFCDYSRENGAPGVHVVTSLASRNRPFYARNGFELLATLGDPGRENVMLGRRLIDG